MELCDCVLVCMISFHVIQPNVCTWRVCCFPMCAACISRRGLLLRYTRRARERHVCYSPHFLSPRFDIYGIYTWCVLPCTCIPPCILHAQKVCTRCLCWPALVFLFIMLHTQGAYVACVGVGIGFCRVILVVCIVFVGRRKH